jgi:hypothetical protein
MSGAVIGMPPIITAPLRPVILKVPPPACDERRVEDRGVIASK